MNTSPGYAPVTHVTTLLTSCFTGVPAPQEISCSECGARIGTVGHGQWTGWSMTGLGGMYCSEHCCDKAMNKARANAGNRRTS